jgi:hypothetical protein
MDADGTGFPSFRAKALFCYTLDIYVSVDFAGDGVCTGSIPCKILSDPWRHKPSVQQHPRHFSVLFDV